MKNLTCFLVVAATLSLLLIRSESRAQQGDVPKVEIGIEFSSLTLSVPGVKREVGAGGRITYNITEHVSFEAEGNFFPSGSTRGFFPGGSILQGQFGIKAGKRWEKFGIFAKARPGFVSFDGSYTPRVVGTEIINGTPSPIIDFTGIGRTNHFSADIGGVIEVYPSRRVVARFDAGDTIIRYGPRNELDFSNNPQLFRVPAIVTHNFQFSAGVGLRLLVPERARDIDGVDHRSQPAWKSSRPKFEVGAHITSLTFNPPESPVSLPAIPGENRPITETGLGGRFTFNLLDSVGLETEINDFPASDGISTGASGRVLQGQFGVKAGKRLRWFGVFAKARPGFVSFSRSLNLVRTESFTRFERQFNFGIFEIERRSFFSTDVGGVLEFYPSRRTVIRFDAGDTIIRYGPRSREGFGLNRLIITVPPETRHNFQFSSGFGFRL